MRFLIATTLTESLRHLDKASREQVKRAAFDFQLDPSNPGFKFHRVERARDRHFWTFRVNRDVRVVVHLTDDTFTLCYAGHHDDAYTWAQRRRLEAHPRTGALQLVEVHERTEEHVHHLVRPLEHEPALFARYELEYLLALGVPVEWIDWVRSATETAFLDQMHRLPQEAAERLLALAAGEAVALPAQPAPDDAAPSLAHPDTQRRIVEVDDRATLEQALDAPWETWIVFLHPEQRALVERPMSGPARISGSAGTGKTVVALHRAAQLARALTAAGAPSERAVLLTTFTQALAARLEYQADLLLGAGSEARCRVRVVTLHGLAVELYGGLGHRFRELEDARLRDFLRDARQQHGLDDALGLDFLLAEWKAIVAPSHLQSWQAYRSAPRIGRGKPLGARQKRQLWSVFESVMERMRGEGLMTWSGLCHDVADALAGRPALRFRHVVADESQDFGHGELRLLRALVEPDADDLFLCTDPGQRIFPAQYSWLQAGIDVRGRAFRLSVNYRTTEQIRSFSDGLMPAHITDEDGNEVERSSHSLYSGPVPQLVGCVDAADEHRALAAWLHELLDAGFSPDDIGICTRTRTVREQRVDPVLAELGLASRPLAEATSRGTNAVAVGAMHGAKGLEFRAVAVVGCDAALLPLRSVLEQMADPGDQDAFRAQERNLLYVASTRARDRLLLTWVGEPSVLLARPRPPLPAQALAELPSPVASPATPADDEAPLEPPRGRSVRLPAPAQHTPFRITPSRIGRYFFHDCERFLRLHATSGEARRVADRVPRTGFDESPLMEAILESGSLWEEEVLVTHLTGRVHVGEGIGPLSQRRFSYEETVELLRRVEPGFFVFQPTLRAAPAFYERYGLDAATTTIPDNRPDLLAVDRDARGRRRFRVIDMKRGASLQSMYRVQVLFYALELEAMLAAEGIDDAVADVRQGAVWLGAHETPLECDLDGVRPHLERCLAEDVPRIFEGAASDAHWHLYHRCEWCPYLEHCRAEMRATNDVSRIARLTRQGKRFLRQHGVSTLPELASLLERSEADEVLEQCASLSGERYSLQARVEALASGRVQLYGASTQALPRATATELAVTVTLQREPLSRTTWLAGILLTSGAEVPAHIVAYRQQPRARTMLAATPQDVPRVRRWLIHELHTLLLRIDAYNYQREWASRLSLQVYVLSNQERTQLTAMLIDALDDPELAYPALSLLFYFQGPDLILSDEHPDDQVPYPVVSLLSVLGQLMALPVEVSYTLPESLATLAASGCTGVPIYPRDGEFHFPLGHALRAELLHALWYGARSGDSPPDAVALQERIERRAEHHLVAIHGLLGALREQADTHVVAWPAKFQLPRLTEVRDPFVSRLIFFSQYEMILRCLEVREGRTRARHELVYDESVLELEALAPDRFAVRSARAEAEVSSFTTYLLATDDLPGRRAQLRYPDFSLRAQPWGGRASAHLAVVAITAVAPDGEGNAAEVTLAYRRKFDGEVVRPGQRFVLYPRFADFNTSKVVDALIAQADSPSFLLRLLREPERAEVDAPLSEGIETACAAEEQALRLTASQLAAYRAIRASRVQAVWGPPGTGKTHFLATMIIALARAHHAWNRPFQVVVTAFTHAAIENLLAKIHALLEAAPGALPLALGKLKEWKGESRGAVVDPKKVARWFERQRIAVAGATVFQLVKDPALRGVDLVVVDEASQMKVPEAMVPAALIGEQGRIVFAGDHLQLPPIIAGEYPEPASGGAVLHRSVFEALLSLRGGQRVSRLLENFRMSDVLTSFPAALLYGRDYVPGAPQVAARRLSWMAVDGVSALVQSCLDPAAPLVAVVLNGIEAARENVLEAALVADLVVALREGLCDASGESYASDEVFFRDGVFVVSPHHAQIRLIKRALRERRAWQSEPFVDTVDKMQGQEADVVIVGYGVSDPEYAQQEATFIYSLNRLNVSITRGRAKTIVFLPRPLLDATPQVLEDEEAAAGLAFMRRLVDAVRHAGEPTDHHHFIVGEGVTADVFRATRVCPVFD